MAELTTLARPYAKAAYDFAKESGVVANWQEYLVFSADVVNNQDLIEYLQQPNKTSDDRLKTLITISNDSYPDDFKNFLAQLAENDRLSLLPAIRTEFENIKSASEKELKAIVETAFELSPAEVALLQAGLEKRFACEVQIETVVKEELIAGVVIRVGDQVIDDSALAKLQEMKTKLTS